MHVCGIQCETVKIEETCWPAMGRLAAKKLASGSIRDWNSCASSSTLAAVPIATRHARGGRAPAALCIVIPDPLDVPVPQRLSRFISRRRVGALRVAQLPVQRGRPCVVRAQRRVPLPARAAITPAEHQHALPFFGM
jgi:hypothetical protein